MSEILLRALNCPIVFPIWLDLSDKLSPWLSYSWIWSSDTSDKSDISQSSNENLKDAP